LTPGKKGTGNIVPQLGHCPVLPIRPSGTLSVLAHAELGQTSAIVPMGCCCCGGGEGKGATAGKGAVGTAKGLPQLGQWAVFPINASGMFKIFAHNGFGHVIFTNNSSLPVRVFRLERKIIYFFKRFVQFRCVSEGETFVRYGYMKSAGGLLSSSACVFPLLRYERSVSIDGFPAGGVSATVR
jgi:hypothetical protein